MILSPLQKFALISTAITIGAVGLIWTGIKIDALALGLNEHAYNIGAVIVTVLQTTMLGILSYLGIKAPTSGAIGERADLTDVERDLVLAYRQGLIPAALVIPHPTPDPTMSLKA